VSRILGPDEASGKDIIYVALNEYNGFKLCFVLFVFVLHTFPCLALKTGSETGGIQAESSLSAQTELELFLARLHITVRLRVVQAVTHSCYDWNVTI
jgi:hypothetical protein